MFGKAGCDTLQGVLSQPASLHHSSVEIGWKLQQALEYGQNCDLQADSVSLACFCICPL